MCLWGIRVLTWQAGCGSEDRDARLSYGSYLPSSPVFIYRPEDKVRMVELKKGHNGLTECLRGEIMRRHL